MADAINSYRANPLIAPLYNYHDAFCKAWDWSELPDGFSAASWEIAKKIVIIVVSPFAYIATLFSAAVGRIFDDCLRGRVEKDENGGGSDINPNIEPNDQPEIPKLDMNKYESGFFEGIDLLIKSDHLDQDILSEKFDDNPDIIVTGTMDGNDLFDEDHYVSMVSRYFNPEENIFVELCNQKPDAKFVLIPVFAHLHYSGIVLNIRDNVVSLYNPKGHQDGKKFRELETSIFNELKKLKFKDLNYDEDSIVTNPDEHQKEGWSCGYRIQKFFDAAVEGNQTLTEEASADFKPYLDYYLEYSLNLEQEYPESEEHCMKCLNNALTDNKKETIFNILRLNLINDKAVNKNKTIFAFLSKNPEHIKPFIQENLAWVEKEKEKLKATFRTLGDSKPNAIYLFTTAYNEVTGKDFFKS